MTKCEQVDQTSSAMLDALPERVVRYRVPDLTVVYCNVSWAGFYGLKPVDAVGRSLAQFLSEDALVGLESQLARLSPENPILTDTQFRAELDAPGQWFEWVDQYIRTPKGTEIVAVGRDVTRRHLAELKLMESEARFRDLADKSSDVVWRFVTQPFMHLDYISPSVETSLGYPQSFFLGDFTRFLGILDDVGRNDIARALHCGRMPERHDFRFRHADGSIVIGETKTTAIRGGLQGVSRDVTELRRLQEEMTVMALRDPLTGLANRRLFNELLEADLARMQRNGLPLAVAFLDLDGLKRVNDTYGHAVGDSVLREIACRLMRVTRAADVAARFGGDEFVIVYEPEETSSNDFVARIDGLLSAPIEITPTLAVSCPASIGTADTRTVGYDAAALLTAADNAMYESKKARRRARKA